MSKRVGGFIGQDGLNAPDEPTGVSASAGDSQATVSFTAPSDVGGAAVSGYRVTDTTGAHGASGSASPITVTGLTNDTAYTFRVWALNAFGYSAPSDASGSVTPVSTDNLAVFMGGAGAAGTVISKFNITTLGNSDNTFGTISSGKEQCSTTGSTTHAFRFGGDGPTNEIFRVSYSSGGAAEDYADLNTAVRLHGAFGNSTRSYLLGGFTTLAGVNTIQTFLYSSTGNSTNFGTMGSETYYVTGCSNSTRGVYSRPTSNSRSNVIEYITLGSSGSSADFGDLTQARFRILCVASATIALFGGGDTSGGDVNTIDYVTIASTGNATDFGDLTASRNRGPTAATTTRGVFAGGYSNTAENRNIIDYVTFASAGNATDFGDMTTNHYEMTGGASSSSAAVS